MLRPGKPQQRQRLAGRACRAIAAARPCPSATVKPAFARGLGGGGHRPHKPVWPRKPRAPARHGAAHWRCRAARRRSARDRAASQCSGRDLRTAASRRYRARPRAPAATVAASPGSGRMAIDCGSSAEKCCRIDGRGAREQVRGEPLGASSIARGETDFAVDPLGAVGAEQRRAQRQFGSPSHSTPIGLWQLPPSAGEQRALGHRPARGWGRGRSPPAGSRVAASSALHSIPIAPCAGAGSQSRRIERGADVGHRRAVRAPRRRARSHRPRPRRACPAASQHCRGTRPPSNRAGAWSTCAARRGALVPTVAPSRQVGEARRADQHVAHVGARQHRGDREARRAGASRHPSANGPRRRSALGQPARRVPWSTAPCRRSRRAGGPEHLVAARQHRDQFDRVLAPAMRGAQPRARFLGLRQGERRAAGAEADGVAYGMVMRRACPKSHLRPVKPRMRMILGIESSCDETAAALVDGRPAHPRPAHRQRRTTRTAPMAGWCPRSPRAPMSERLAPLIEAVLAEAGMALAEVDAIAATAGPGLIGGVMVGLVTAKALAMASDKPLDRDQPPRRPCAVAAAGRCRRWRFPIRCCWSRAGIASCCGSTGVGHYRRLATTIDDALGEAFDKTAKLLGLGFPGGPAVERLAARGRSQGRAAAPPAARQRRTAFLLRRASRARCCARRQRAVCRTPISRRASSRRRSTA